MQTQVLAARDTSKHKYELVPMVNGVHEYPYRAVGEWKRESAGEAHALGAAIALMGERPDVDQVRIYHTHPSPGPVRRYLGAVNRSDMELRYAG